MTNQAALPNLIILGPQGSGKGTQAQLLAKRFGYTVIGMGQLLRNRASRGDPAGKKIGQILAKGILVPDQTLRDVLEDRLDQLPPETPLIFDGVPRNSAQVAMFERIMSRHGSPLPLVIVLKAPRRLVLERIASRQVCKHCGARVGLFSRLAKLVCPSCGAALDLREDDRAEAIERRLNIFYSDTIPVIDHYRRAGRLIEINDDGPIDEVHTLIVNALPLAQPERP